MNARGGPGGDAGTLRRASCHWLRDFRADFVVDSVSWIGRREHLERFQLLVVVPARGDGVGDQFLPFTGIHSHDQYLIRGSAMA